MNILVTGSGNITGLNIVKALSNSDNNIFGCDLTDYNPADTFCKNFQIVSCDNKSYIDDILNIVEKHSINAIIPSNDHEMRFFSTNQGLFSKLKIFVNGVSKNSLDLLDKEKTSTLFRSFEIRTPKVLAEIKLPCVVRKNEVGQGSKFVHILKTDLEVESFEQDRLKDAIITEFIEGEEFTVDVLVNNENQVLSCVPRLRRIVKNGMVHLGELVNDLDVIKETIELAEKMELRGMNCIQCIKNELGCFFFEVNPRPGSGIDITVAGGHNYPSLWVDLLEGKRLIINEPEWGLKMLRVQDGYFFK